MQDIEESLQNNNFRQIAANFHNIVPKDVAFKFDGIDDYVDL